ncbi:uncharacterized protein LACBIDRAFT_314207 [Laccaria bicolor S238N-H82]|uniref:Predicted protein n=1 Tax=Laccaria bicolor (strain S238N-H82 / ATCC MYA-4686) TaxID=486041 RepID=B0D1T7_LACBS|nr:uncharacterized protein LACBIDRAFT_314207 [Laccaria bicolor S238N-H82]EDR11700.1 predicted protein [Laccaria bicolor S238N-H82]|eukprot:XP_001877597.1 predicted protein [Laccaria bicolor S238N-H82]
MSDVTSKLTSQRQSANGEDVMPYTNLSSSSRPHSVCLPPFAELSGHYYVLVEDLSSEVNNYILEKAFSAFGTMSLVCVCGDKNSGKYTGSGFLAFKRETDAELAIATMNGKRFGSQEIVVNWGNQKLHQALPTTTASSHRCSTSGSAPAPPGSEYLLHDSQTLDRTFLEGFKAPDCPTVLDLDSMDPEVLLGTPLSDPEDSTLSSDTLPHRKTVALAHMVNFSQKRRRQPARFQCTLCTQTFM